MHRDKTPPPVSFDDDARPSSPGAAAQAHVRRIGGWHMDLETREIAWSEEVHALFGIPPTQKLTYDDFVALVHPEDQGLVNDAWEAAMHGAPYNVDHRVIVDGRVYWVRERAIVLFDAHGRPLEADGTVQDVTAEHEAQSRTTYHETLRRAMHGFWRVSHDGRVVECNPAAANMLGYTEAELTGMHIAQIDTYDDPSMVRTRIEAVRAGSRLRFETQHRRADGTVLDVRVSAYPWIDDTHIAVVFTEDISEEKRELEGLHTQLRRLEGTLQWIEAHLSSGVTAGDVSPATADPILRRLRALK